MNAAFDGWHKSSYSTGNGADCVEQGAAPDGTVGVRDTKLGEDSPVLDFSSEAWAAFVTEIKAGGLTGGIV